MSRLALQARLHHESPAALTPGTKIQQQKQRNTNGE